MALNRGLASAWWALRTGLGLGPLLAGLDKFFNLLADWTMYLSPLEETVLHVSPRVFRRGVGIVEMVFDIAVRDVEIAIAACTLAASRPTWSNVRVGPCAWAR